MACNDGTACGDEIYTGNVTPILNEIKHALNTLIETGESTTIDLRALPMAPGEEQQLESMLWVLQLLTKVYLQASGL